MMLRPFDAELRCPVRTMRRVWVPGRRPVIRYTSFWYCVVEAYRSIFRFLIPST